MNIVSQFLANSSDLKKFLANPVITREAKKNIVKDVLGEQIAANTLKFLLLLIDRNRIALLDGVAQRYLELSYKFKNQLKLQKLYLQFHYQHNNSKILRKN